MTDWQALAEWSLLEGPKSGKFKQAGMIELDSVPVLNPFTATHCKIASRIPEFRRSMKCALASVGTDEWITRADRSLSA